MARGRKTQVRVELTPETRQQLECCQRATSIPAGLARRARLVLLLASGASVSDAARLVGMQRRHVYKWVERFNRCEMEGLHDLPRGGARQPERRALQRPVGGTAPAPATDADGFTPHLGRVDAAG